MFWNDSLDRLIEITDQKACAQMILMPCYTGGFDEVADLDETIRGDGHHGSTDELGSL